MFLSHLHQNLTLHTLFVPNACISPIMAIKPHENSEIAYENHNAKHKEVSEGLQKERKYHIQNLSGKHDSITEKLSCHFQRERTPKAWEEAMARQASNSEAMTLQNPNVPPFLQKSDLKDTHI